MRAGKAYSLLIVVLCGVLVTGCSDNPTRQSGKDLNKAVETAQRHYDTALSLFNQPVYTVGKETAPLTEVKPAGELKDIKLGESNALNPAIWENLTQAGEVLTAALTTVGEADPADKALAEEMLARVNAFKGLYQGARALNARMTEMQAIDAANAAISRANVQGGLVSYFDTLAKFSVEDLQKEIQTQGEALTKAQQDVANTEGQIKKLSDEKKALTATMEQHNVKAREFRSESRLTHGQESLDKFQAALAEELEVANLTSQITDVELKIESQNIALQGFKLTVAAVEKKVAFTKELLNARETGKDEASKCQQQIVKDVEANRSEIAANVETIVTTHKVLGDAYVKAVNAYKESVRSFGTARKGQTPLSKVLSVMVQEGDTLLALADLEVRWMELQEAGSKLALRVKAVAPSQAEKLLGFSADQETVRRSAGTHYREAADLFTKTISSLDSTQKSLKWAYQGQAAAAYMGLYQFSREAKDLKMASDLLQEAIKDREASPFVASFVKLHRLASGG